MGLLLAVLEGIFRLKDGLFKVKPAEEMNFPPAIYGAPLALLADSLLANHVGLVREMPIPVEGFYSEGFCRQARTGAALWQHLYSRGLWRGVSDAHGVSALAP